MADSSVQLARVALNEASDDEDLALMAAEVDVDRAAAETENRSDAQVNGVMVLALLDKIIGVVDQIQHTQSRLDARQQDMERSVTGIQGDLAKLSKSHTTTSNTVNKMLEKVHKVNVNVKTMRSSLEKQAGQIKRLESNENELLKRRNFKVLIYPDEMKAPSKITVSKSKKGSEKAAEGGGGEGVLEGEEAEQGGREAQPGVSSDEEVEIEEIIEESRAERIKRSGLQRMDNIKKAFSREKMEKTKQRTRENLEKTRQRTRENLEKTRQRTRENLEKTKHSLEKKMGKLSTRMAVKPERREKVKTSQEKLKKSLTPEHTIYARSKSSVYRVPPFTFHVKKIREGEVEVHAMEMVEAAEEEEVEEEEEEGEELEGLDTAELLSQDSPEVLALLEVAKDSELVLVERNHQGESD